MARVTGLALASLFIVLIVPAAASPVFVPPPVAHPPEFTHQLSGNRGLLMWVPGEVRCVGEAAPAGQALRRPHNTVVHSSAAAAKPVTLRFAIDTTGRTHSIAVESSPAAYQWDEISAALASSRFVPGRAYTACSVTYSNSFAEFDTAPLPELVSYSMNQVSGRLPREAWQRIEAGADCFASPRPQQLLRAYPDFGKILGTPGVRDWSLVRYDTDVSGRPKRPVLVTGTGNRALDAASISAVAESRFTAGARSGCLYPYYRNAVVLEAPTMPDKPVEPAACERRDGWQVKPVLQYPAAYSRRSIEGWAVIRYDIAPWGAIGNVSVVDAQPSADFGRQAKRMIEMARAKPSETGAQNCVVHVRYEMGLGASQNADAAAETSY